MLTLRSHIKVQYGMKSQLRPPMISSKANIVGAARPGMSLKNSSEIIQQALEVPRVSVADSSRSLGTAHIFPQSVMRVKGGRSEEP